MSCCARAWSAEPGSGPTAKAEGTGTKAQQKVSTRSAAVWAAEEAKWHQAVQATTPKGRHTGRSCMRPQPNSFGTYPALQQNLCWQPWDSPDEQEVKIHQLFLKGDGFHTFWTGKAYAFSCPATLGRLLSLSEEIDTPSFILGCKELLMFRWLTLSRNRIIQGPTQSSEVERQVFQNNHKQGMGKESKTRAFKSSLHLRSASFSP